MFKVGDRVVCVKDFDNPRINKGDIYTIAACGRRQDTKIYHFEEIPDMWWAGGSFKLYEEKKQMKFNKGGWQLRTTSSKYNAFSKILHHIGIENYKVFGIAGDHIFQSIDFNWSEKHSIFTDMESFLFWIFTPEESEAQMIALRNLWMKSMKIKELEKLDSQIKELVRQAGVLEVQYNKLKSTIS